MQVSAASYDSVSHLLSHPGPIRHRPPSAFHLPCRSVRPPMHAV